MVGVARSRGQGPVRREANVEVILRELRGIARYLWLEKWARTLREAARRLGVDPQAVWGLRSWRPEEVARLLLEYCHGLTESECRAKLLGMAEARATAVEEKLARQAFEDYIRHMEEKADTIARAVELFNLPVDLDERTAMELLEIHRNPELDGERVREIVKGYLTRELMWPEDEAERVAEEAARVIQKVAGQKPEARATAAAHILGLARYSRYSARRRVEMAMRDIEKRLEKLMLEMYKYMRTGGRVLLSLRELQGLGYAVYKEGDPEEVIAELERRRWIRVPVPILTPPRRLPTSVEAVARSPDVLCVLERVRLARHAARYGLAPRMCTDTVVFVDRRRRAYAVVGPASRG